MRFTAPNRLLFCCLLVAVATLAAACGGGGGGGGGGAGDAVIARITVSGIGPDLFQNGQSTQPVAPIGAFPNSAVRFFFAGPVSAASLPADGPAVGSIRIADVATAAPAQGTWSIEGANNEIAVFAAFPPLDVESPCSAGLAPNATYAIFVADSQGGNTDVVMIGGQPISQAVSTQFVVVDCDPANPLLVDPVPGPPIAIPNTPPTLDATAPMIDPTVIAGVPGSSRIIIDFNEPVLGSAFNEAINPGGVQILNVSANPGVEIPVAIAAVQFDQLGTIPGVSVARLTLTTTSELADGDVYELRLFNVSDLGQNIFSTMPGELQFTVIDQLDDQMFTFNEDFSTTDNLGEIPQGSAISWAGTGTVEATFPIDVVGTGVLGSGLISTPMIIDTEDFMINGMQVSDGAFNFTDLSINPSATPGFTVTFTSTSDEPPGESNFSVRIRATGTIDIGGGTVLGCDGRDGAPAGALGDAPTMLTRGGYGGPGAGRGGDGSPNTDGTISLTGTAGGGANIDPFDSTVAGNSVNSIATSPLFGAGGPGGRGTAPIANASGGGGATTSSFDGNFMVITPVPPATWTFAASSAGLAFSPTSTGPAGGLVGPNPAAAVTPIAFGIAGSGGGGGGDAFVITGVAFDRPGGAGGGGGGGIRISAGGTITLGSLTQINCRGGGGGAAVIPGTGNGGGGSGGSILMQTFDVINFGMTNILQTRGGNGGSGGGVAGTGGMGGDGVIQLEDSNASALLTSALSLIISGEILPRAFQFQGSVSGLAISDPIDTGSISTNYTSASAIFDNGLTGTAEVFVRGLAENPDVPGTAATTMTTGGGVPLMSAAVPLANISQLNGYRFFRLEINTNFPPPPVTAIGDPLPSVSDVTVNYSR
ncbi:MAG: hypothetical protein V3W41_10500 [Planctomycetota bacterium]